MIEFSYKNLNSHIQNNIIDSADVIVCSKHEINAIRAAVTTLISLEMLSEKKSILELIDTRLSKIATSNGND